MYKGTLKDGREIAVVSLTVPVHYWNDYVELYFQKEKSANQLNPHQDFLLLYNRIS